MPEVPEVPDVPGVPGSPLSPVVTKHTITSSLLLNGDVAEDAELVIFNVHQVPLSVRSLIAKRRN